MRERGRVEERAMQIRVRGLRERESKSRESTCMPCVREREREREGGDEY